MLKTLTNFLSKNIFKKSGKNNFNRLKNPDFLVEPNKIISVLREIEATSLLCTIQIDSSRGSYSSSILKIRTDPNTIIIDELTPNEGNALLQEKKALKLSTFYQGLRLTFNLSHVETGISRGATYYKAALPERIFYPQRRKALRIKVSLKAISFSGIVQGGTLIKGTLFDLSQSGAYININSTANSGNIQHGDKIKKCQIIFENFVMDFDFIVRFVKSQSTGSSRLQIGGSFENLSNKNQSKLAGFITSMQRDEIRKRTA